MTKARHRKRVVADDAHFVVKVIPAAVNDPSSPDEVVREYNEYLASFTALADPGVVARARDELAREIRDATENEERRGDPDEIVEVVRRH